MGFYDVFRNYIPITYLPTYLILLKTKIMKKNNIWALYIYHKISQINNSRLSNTENAISSQFSLILIEHRVWHLLHSIILRTHTIHKHKHKLTHNA